MKNKTFLLFVIFVALVWFYGGKRIMGEKKTNMNSFGLESQEVGQGESVKFEELTIPFLRDRRYEGLLGERNVYQQKNNYTSYLTSYSSDDLKINGLLTIPKGESPVGGWPAVVFVHGYIPPTLYKTTEKYLEYVDYLAKSGLVVFKIDLRGHGESEGDPGGAYYSSDYVVDVLNAYNALEKSGLVNTNKIGLWGHSMGGNVVFRATVVKKEIPKVVIWAGAVYSYSDMAKYGIQDNSYRPLGMTVARQKRRQELFDTYGQFNEKNSFWRQVVGLNFLEGVTTKFSIHHAVDDSVVNIGYSRDLQKELSEKNVSAELFEYASGGHNISGGSFGVAIKRSVEFFRN